MADFRRGGVGDGLGDMGQDGVAHAGDFQDSHGSNMVRPVAPAKGKKVKPRR